MLPGKRHGHFFSWRGIANASVDIGVALFPLYAGYSQEVCVGEGFISWPEVVSPGNFQSASEREDKAEEVKTARGSVTYETQVRWTESFLFFPFIKTTKHHRPPPSTELKRGFGAGKIMKLGEEAPAGLSREGSSLPVRVWWEITYISMEMVRMLHTISVHPHSTLLSSSVILVLGNKYICISQSILCIYQIVLPKYLIHTLLSISFSFWLQTDSNLVIYIQFLDFQKLLLLSRGT